MSQENKSKWVFTTKAEAKQAADEANKLNDSALVTYQGRTTHALRVFNVGAFRCDVEERPDGLFQVVAIVTVIEDSIHAANPYGIELRVVRKPRLFG